MGERKRAGRSRNYQVAVKKRAYNIQSYAWRLDGDSSSGSCSQRKANDTEGRKERRILHEAQHEFRTRLSVGQVGPFLSPNFRHFSNYCSHSSLSLLCSEEGFFKESSERPGPTLDNAMSVSPKVEVFAGQ